MKFWGLRDEKLSAFSGQLSANEKKLKADR
jgi:hypothetical protein